LVASDIEALLGSLETFSINLNRDRDISNSLWAVALSRSSTAKPEVSPASEKVFFSISRQHGPASLSCLYFQQYVTRKHEIGASFQAPSIADPGQRSSTDAHHLREREDIYLTRMRKMPDKEKHRANIKAEKSGTRGKLKQNTELKK
jgi:hypothetical protein